MPTIPGVSGIETQICQYSNVKIKDFSNDMIDFYLSFTKWMGMSTNTRPQQPMTELLPFRCGGFDYKITTQCLRKMIFENKFNVFEPDRPRRLAGIVIFF